MPGPNGASYCTPAQLAQVVQPAVLGLTTSAQQLQACANATAVVDAYMSGRYAMPLSSWDDSITLYTSYVAAYQLVRLLLGVAPVEGGNDVYDRMLVEAIGGQQQDPNAPRREGFFEKVQRQAINPSVTPAIAVGSNPACDSPQVSSLPMRRWQHGNRIGGF